MRWRRPRLQPGSAPDPRDAGPRSNDTIAAGDRSIAIDTRGAPFLGVANTGDHTTIVQVPPGELCPPAEVDAPRGLVNLPAHHAAFVGRTHELELLDTALNGPGTAVVQALHGLGGVGKSTLAAHWAATRTGTDNPIWWITADSPANRDAGLAALARSLQPALAQLPAEQLTERAVHWLATHTGWLLVLDNVADPADVAPLLARATTGRFLITSRRASGWHNTATPVPLDVLNPLESLDLLTRILTRSGTRTTDLDGAFELCDELGHLPLAVEQAGAFIAEAGTSVRDYLGLLADHPAAMYREAAEGHDSERTIARIWHITLDRLTDTPLAGQILRILAWYAPTGIPRTLLSPLSIAVAVQHAIRRLAAYSMITTSEGGLLDVHRLVQAVARTPDADDPHRQEDDVATALRDATRLLKDALPTDRNDPGIWPTWRTLLPHCEALTHHAPPDSDTPTTATLLDSTGLFRNEQGQTWHAVADLERALDDRVRLLGEDQPDTLLSRNNLAVAYERAGHLSRAIQLHEQTLADRVRLLGEDHPDCLLSRNNLAHAHESAGDLGRAIPLHERNVKDMVRVLGTDHPLTLASHSNLADAYQASGDLTRAIPLYEQTVKDMVRVLGENHRYPHVSRNSLAHAYQAAGNLSRAIELHERTLADRVRMLGEDHPDTLVSRLSLADAYQAADGPGRAIPLHEQTVGDMVRVLGEDHPDTLVSRNNLASAHHVAGDLDRAIALHERTMKDMVRVLGEDHPDTLVSRNNLAQAYRAVGDFDRAIPLHKRTLSDRVRALGENHPETLASRSNLAQTYQEAGDLNRAIPLHEQTLADRVRVLGENHPETLTSRNNLAQTYQEAGDLDRAIPLFEQTVKDMIRALGANHPDTLASRNNLAHAYWAGGDPRRAIPLHEQTMRDMVRVLGEDHPSTLISRNNLALAYEAAGDPGRAIPLFEQTVKDMIRVLGEKHPSTRTAVGNLDNARSPRANGN
ncbi:tetratricopeptide repeat protein [Streptomyces sp. NPDC058745]|uniref:tetratricopeptide repeat protein n=1 Tax=Streptomyces sp. NPDC058745 TaxID=3346621 RepID=UPI0036A5A3F6